MRQSDVGISLSSAGLELSDSGAAARPAPPLEPSSMIQPPPQPPPPVPPAKAELKGGTRYWKDLNKTLGPLQLRRVGGEWIADEGRLGILLDAAISLAGLTVGLSGLSVNVKPEKLTSLTFDDLGFKLDGMALDFQRGPISISGMLLKGQNDSYSGKAMIRAATFSIGAIGGTGGRRPGNRLSSSSAPLPEFWAVRHASSCRGLRPGSDTIEQLLCRTSIKSGTSRWSN